MQDCSNSSSLAMELLQSGTKPSKWYETMIFILLLFVHQMELDHQRARFKDDLNLVNAENESLKVKIEELKGDVVSLDWLRFSMFIYAHFLYTMPSGWWIFSVLFTSDVIMNQWPWSTFVQVMAWCLMAPSHYLNKCWRLTSHILWSTSQCVLIVLLMMMKTASIWLEHKTGIIHYFALSTSRDGCGSVTVCVM